MQTWDADMGCKHEMQTWDGMLTWDAVMGCRREMQTRDADMGCRQGMQTWDADMGCKHWMHICRYTTKVCLIDRGVTVYLIQCAVASSVRLTAH